MKEERVIIPCDELSLDGVLGLPQGNGPFPAVAVCHPHPLYGGSMDNNVVYAACAALARESIAFLRFNFRGVGRSTGNFADGIGEQDDVRAALTFLEVRNDIDQSRLGLCGYSFGTMVAIPVADTDKRVRAIAAISPFFVSSGLLMNYANPKLFICGERDEFIDHKEIERIAGKLPDPKLFEQISGANHFWGGFEKTLENKIATFFAPALSIS